MNSKEEILNSQYEGKQYSAIKDKEVFAAMDEYWNVGYEAGKKEAQFKMRQDVKRFLETHSPYNDPNFFHIHLMEIINGTK